MYKNIKKLVCEQPEALSDFFLDNIDTICTVDQPYS